MDIRNVATRARYLEKIREYFKELSVIEVETPLAYQYAVSDPFIDVFDIDTLSGKRYLQSSPEYAMKRLLAQGSGSIYQICKAFRNEQQGKNHNYEFTMLEWYRVEIDHIQLMSEMKKLFSSLKLDLVFKHISYRDVFLSVYTIDPHTASVDELEQLCNKFVGEIHGATNLTKADYLDILFSYKVEKELNAANTLYFIYDYTVDQSALAKIIVDDFNTKVAARFEVFYNGLELANAYYELIDKDEQLARFNNDNRICKQNNKPIIELDEKLINSLDSIPECSGVAMGLDRLIMSFEDISDISEIIMI